jgi:hypothetical protein
MEQVGSLFAKTGKVADHRQENNTEGINPPASVE